MGLSNSKEKLNYKGITNFRDSSTKVRAFSEEEKQGTIFEFQYGSYNSNVLIPALGENNNIFAIEVAPNTKATFFGGDMFDYGGKGSMQLVNTTQNTISLNVLPENIAGLVRSISITKLDPTITVPLDAQDADYQTKLMSSLEKFDDLNEDKSCSSNLIYLIMCLILIFFLIYLFKN